MLDPVFLELGPLTIRWYALLIGLAFVIGILMTFSESKRQGIDPEFFLDFFLLAIPLGIIGARLYYVIFHWQRYSGDFTRLFAIWEGGLAIHGGVIAGAIILVIMAYRRRVNFWQATDILAPPLALGETIGRWGNFFNQEAFGQPVSEEFISYFPEFIQQQMYIQGQYRNPTFFYASVWNLLILVFLLWLRRRDFIKQGDVFLSYIISYSVGRFFIEGMRIDSLMLGPLRVAQVVSVLLIILGVIFIYYQHKEKGA